MLNKQELGTASTSNGKGLTSLKDLSQPMDSAKIVIADMFEL